MATPPTIADVLLIGRVNVGKSTLFNRLTGLTRALVSATPGTTRDLNRGRVSWRDREFLVTDSGGLNPESRDPAGHAVITQTTKALREADVIVFVVDGETGLTPDDYEIAKLIRKTKTPAVLAINKADSPNRRASFSGISLGFKDEVLLSAKNGSGVGDLLDMVVQHLPANTLSAPTLRIGFLGQSNVGKSSLFNRIIGNDRSIVLPTLHTTRNPVYEVVHSANSNVELVDTAGMRRRMTRASDLERISVAQAVHSLEEVDVALLTLDASAPAAWQDQRIGGIIAEAQVAAIILLNKSDLVRDAAERKRLELKLNRYLPMLPYARRIWVSAKSGENVGGILPEAEESYQAWTRELTPTELAQVTRQIGSHRYIRNLPFAGFAQTGSKPPSFVLKLKTKENIPVALRGLAETKLRERFGFGGSPIRIRIEGLKKR